MPLFPINLTPEWIVPKLINKIYQSLWRSRFLSKGQWVSLLCYYLHLEKEWPFIEPITSYLYLRILCAKFYIKRFFKFSMFFFSKLSKSAMIFHFEVGHSLPLNYISWIPIPQGHFVPSRRFLKVVNVFLLFCHLITLDMAWLFIWTNLNPLNPTMLHAKFGWNWHRCF